MCSAVIHDDVRNKHPLLLLLKMLTIVLFMNKYKVESAQIMSVAYPSLVDPLPCQSDAECPDTSYCFRVGQVCTDCFNCTSQFRKARVRCARFVQDCGDCLPGYTEQTYSRFSSSDRRWCKEMINKVIAEPRNMNMDDTVITLSLKWPVLVVVACISALGFASYYCYTSSNRRDMAVSDSGSVHELNTHYVSPPPPYNVEREMDADGSVPVSYELRITEHPINDKQKAVPFPYLFDNSVSSDGSNNGQIGGVQPSENHSNNTTDSTFSVPSLDIHDETTTPSFWTPGNTYGAVASTNETEEDDEKISPPSKRKRVEESSCEQAQKESKK